MKSMTHTVWCSWVYGNQCTSCLVWCTHVALTSYIPDNELCDMHIEYAMEYSLHTCGSEECLLMTTVISLDP